MGTWTLRAKVLNSLLEAHSTGDLQELLEEARLLTLQRKVRDLLLDSANNGKLTKALQADLLVGKEMAKTCVGNVDAVDGLDTLDTTVLIENTSCNDEEVSRPRSEKHAHLLEKERLLKRENSAFERRIAHLKEKTGHRLSSPTVSKPECRSRLVEVQMVQQLSDLNASLTSENARLNAELARLLARAAIE